MKNILTIAYVTRIVLTAAAFCSVAYAQEQVIFALGTYNQGGDPTYASPITDSAGNLYVELNYTENNDPWSLIFKLAPPIIPNGQWSVASASVVDGALNAGLLVDSTNNFYGTASGADGQFAFKISSTGTVTNLYTFAENYFLPASTLVMDASGNLYGASANYGSIFELQPPASGQTTWTEKTIYTLSSPNSYPTGVVLDEKGNLYGIALNNVTLGLGVVFELSPPSSGNGSWTEQTIYTFPAGEIKPKAMKPKGVKPKGYAGIIINTLTIDGSGNLYGTTYTGGSSGNGSVFELSPPSSGGSWTYNTLYSFAGIPDGSSPGGNVTLGENGVIYGTTVLGGPITAWGGGGIGLGTIWELTPPKQIGGSWTEKILRNFTGGFDGAFPFTAPIPGPFGRLYGVTATGGNGGAGGGGPCDPLGLGYSIGCGVVYQVDVP